ncbi:PmeII family type II restriction endonuclease [Chloroflexus sp.]|uniref:PmeII family type II restriction endonuclease n=1 Tax=Chloroflexus sp. TaxID=1904827 RepID=UPI00298F0534|nr:PmeII family type II restriction endonuclease [Chloroflexus sp.]MCS6889585.1 PmeII family type II restriction endonuclease [Chloroflexus sp.]MDW8404639.1 PmeII family type II restriction endonuclease [Chloroflexus sp.]
MSSNELIVEAKQYVQANIGTFHEKRLNSLRNLELRQILKRKNPYLFRAKNILVAAELVRLLLEAHLSSQEETLFGEFLEGLAIGVCSKTFNGWKSSFPSIDLEFRKGNFHYIVSIKSGPNWGNADQIRKMRENFREASDKIRQQTPDVEVIAVNGCCYGQEANPDKGDYWKLCGQAFWSFISNGEEELYKQIIEPLGFEARERNEAFQQAYAEIINTLTAEFIRDFCNDQGAIDWDKLVEFNSSRQVVNERRRKYQA